MKEKDFHKIVRETSSNDNEILYNALAKKHTELTHKAKESEGKAKKKFSARFFTAVFAPVAAAVLVAILVPTLLLNNRDAPDNNDAHKTPIRQYIVTQLSCTVAEYNEINNTNFLYFDWANVTDYKVIEYSQQTTKTFLGLKVSIVNTETSDNIEYTVCKENDPLDFLENHSKICTNESVVSDCSVKWTTVNDKSYGIFNYDNYDYYITLKDNSDETRMLELIQFLLEDR